MSVTWTPSFSLSIDSILKMEYIATLMRSSRASENASNVSRFVRKYNSAVLNPPRPIGIDLIIGENRALGLVIENRGLSAQEAEMPSAGQRVFTGRKLQDGVMKRRKSLTDGREVTALNLHRYRQSVLGARFCIAAEGM